jgi:hypothetical protein
MTSESSQDRFGPDQRHPPTPRARRHRLHCHARSDGGHHPRRCACPGHWCRLRGPRWWRDDPVVRVRRGDRLLLGREHRHCRRSSSLERSPRRAIRADGSVADRDLVGPAPGRGSSRSGTATFTELVNRAVSSRRAMSRSQPFNRPWGVSRCAGHPWRGGVAQGCPRSRPSWPGGSGRPGWAIRVRRCK